MANIHRISDLPSGGGGRRQGGYGRQGGFFGMMNSQQVNENLPQDARKETFWDMLQIVCCPQFSWQSFIVIVTCLDVLVFLATLGYGGIETPCEERCDFLQIPAKTLQSFGGKWTCKMRYNFEVWRFFFPMFLHANFRHIFFNCFYQMIVGINLEVRHGMKKIVIIYLLSGLGGNLLSAVCSNVLSVGASTSIFGLLGSIIGHLILNWSALDPRYYPGSPRNQMACFLGIIIVLNLMGGFSPSAQTDNFGHIGGLIVGTLLGYSILNPIAPETLPVDVRSQNPNIPSEQQRKKNQQIGLLITAFVFFCGIFAFYFVSNIDPCPPGS